MSCVKVKVMTIFKTNTTKDYSKPTRVKNVYGGGRKSRKANMQKHYEDNITQNIRNIFKLNKQNETIKDRIIKDINTLFEEEDYCKSVKVGIFDSNSCFEYECNGDKLKTLSIKEYLNKIKSYLKDIMCNLEKSDTWKIQLTITINFIFLKTLMKNTQCIERVITL